MREREKKKKRKKRQITERERERERERKRERKKERKKEREREREKARTKGKKDKERERERRKQNPQIANDAGMCARACICVRFAKNLAWAAPSLCYMPVVLGFATRQCCTECPEIVHTDIR